MSLTKKLVVVGDGGVGKTWLVMAFNREPLPKRYEPTVCDTRVISMQVEGIQVSLSVHDTAGQEGYDRLRPLAYPETDIFILCFSINSQDSFENIRVKWLPEIKHHCPSTPFILVGTKEDLRGRLTDIKNLVQPSEGQNMSHQIKAYAYLECSSITDKGIMDVFQTAVKATLQAVKRPRRKLCQIL